MRTVSAPMLVPSTKIDGSFSALPEVIFQPSDFRALCGLIWAKPDTAIAVITGKTDRQAREYLAGNVPPPGVLVAAIALAISKRN